MRDLAKWTMSKVVLPVGGKREKEKRGRMQRDASIMDDSRWLPTPRHRCLENGEFTKPRKKEVNTKCQHMDSLHSI